MDRLIGEGKPFTTIKNPSVASAFLTHKAVDTSARVWELVGLREISASRLYHPMSL